MDKIYVPIDCNYYDYLEAFAVKREKVWIKFLKEGRESLVQAYIEDLETTPDKQEFMHLSDGGKLRLDQLLSVNDIPNPGYC